VSYILDALRKSEQQRRLGMAPSLLTVPVTSEENTQHAFLIYGLMAATLIGAGVAIGWSRPWLQPPPLAATESATADLLGSRPRHSVPPPLPALPEMVRQSEQEKPVQQSFVAVKPAPALEVASLKQDKELPAKPPAAKRELPPATIAAIPRTAPPVREVKPAPMQEKATTPVQEKSSGAGAAPADPAQLQKVISMAELPPAIQQELPPISIPVHTYSSTPKERIVGINDRLLQEGDFLAPGLRVEQIAPDGVIFSYKNYRFRHGL
jgi:general secretion pathway protein B